MDVGQHCTKLWHRAIHSGKSKNFVAAYVSLVTKATCRQTRAITDSSCEAGELSYEVASDVSTDTGDQCLTA